MRDAIKGYEVRVNEYEAEREVLLIKLELLER